jgi:hypothetical protein
MPTPQSKRTVVLDSSFSAATVSQSNVLMDALFTTTGNTANKFDDESGGNAEEKTKYRMKFMTSGNAEIGVLTMRLVSKGVSEQGGVTTAKTDARLTTSPTATASDVTLIASPAASFERIWKQAVLNASDVEYVDDVVKLDMRVSATAGYTVVQTVQTQTDAQLIIHYSWTDQNGAAIVSGTVKLDTSVAVGAGYHLGRNSVTDNNPTTGEERRR